jgi:hypothetical protein
VMLESCSEKEIVIILLKFMEFMLIILC